MFMTLQQNVIVLILVVVVEYKPTKKQVWLQSNIEISNLSSNNDQGP